MGERIFKKNDEISSLFSVAGLSGLVPDSILEFMEIETFEKGDYLISNDSPIEKIYFHVSGRSKVYRDLANGHTATFRFYGKGDIIGDVEFFLNSVTSASIAAVSRVKCVTVPYGVLYENLSEIPKLLMLLGKSVSEKMRSNSVIMTINSFYRLEDRVAMYLACAEGVSEHKMFRNIEYGSFQELSELLGTSYRNLSRVLRSLEQKGLIIRENSLIRVKDMNWLMQIRENEIY